MATRFGRKNPWPKFNALLGSRVNQGSLGVKQRSNCSEMPNGYQICRKTKVQRILLRSKVILGSPRVNQRSNCLGMICGHQIWYEEPLSKAQHIAEVKGQPEVKLLRNVPRLWLSDLVGRTPNQSIIH